MFKRFLFLSGVLLPLAVYAQPVSFADPFAINGIIKVSEFAPEPREIHTVARTARNRGEQPASFTGVTFTLQPNVRQITPAQVNSMRPRMSVDGVLDVSGQPTFRPNADSIYFDPASDLVFQPIQVDDNQMVIVKPGLSNVFQQID